VRVPEGVGQGKAKVTVSFAAWKEGKVSAGAYEVEAIGAAAAKAEDLQRKREDLERQRQQRIAKRAGIEKALREPFWTGDDREDSVRLSDFLDYWSARYDVAIKLNPADFGVQDTKAVLQKEVRYRSSSKKAAAQYLTECLEQVGARYEVRDDFIQVVPLKGQAK
jgi:hypothetical protein